MKKYIFFTAVFKWIVPTIIFLLGYQLYHYGMELEENVPTKSLFSIGAVAIFLFGLYLMFEASLESIILFFWRLMFLLGVSFGLYFLYELIRLNWEGMKWGLLYIPSFTLWIILGTSLEYLREVQKNKKAL